jgi:hypothetical protein
VCVPYSEFQNWDRLNTGNKLISNNVPKFSASISYILHIINNNITVSKARDEAILAEKS